MRLRVAHCCAWRFFLLTSIVPIALLCSTPARAQQSKTSIAAIESLIRSQQYDQALRSLRAGLRASPQDFKLWTLEGICLALQGNDTGAVTAFDGALRIAPDYLPALRGEVQILYKTGDKRAIPLLRRMLRSDADDVTEHEMLAMLERRAGDCRAALVQFDLSKSAIASHPDSLEAFAYCLVKVGRTDDAIAAFRQLIPLVPAQTYPRYDLALLLISEHDNSEAASVLEPLLTPDQTDPDVLSLASQAYEDAGNTPKAVELQRQAIVLDPADPANYVLFAVLCLTHDSFQVGIDMLNAGLKHISDNPSLYLSRGVLYVQLADYDKAEADFGRAQQLDSKQSVSAYAGDLAMLEKNDPAAALLRVRAQLKVHPESPLLHLLLARLLMENTPDPGSPAFNEAMHEALIAAGSKPDLVDAHNQLASMYMSLSQYDRAARECRTALQYDPSNETAMFHLILALRHSGHNDELQPLVRRLSEIHEQSMHNETARKSYRLVEEGSPDAQTNAGH